MNFLKRYLGLFCVLNIFALVFNCNDGQVNVNGRCCDLCHPGYYVEKFCSDHQQTVCKPCKSGFFSDKPSIFDVCEECSTCEQEYAEKCTATTDAKCSCRPGFLCSNNICSECERDKCVSGEKLKRAAVQVGHLTRYTYECEPICLDDAYYDEKKNTCMTRKQCSAFGLVELFAGNKTHNSKCQMDEMQKMGSLYVVVIIGFVLFFLSILLIFTYQCVKKMKKLKARINKPETIAFTASECCKLSKEETTGIIEQKVDSFG